MKDNIVYLGIKGRVVSFDKRNGNSIWDTHLKSSGFVTVMVDEEIIFAHTGGHFYGVDRVSGRILWENGLSGLGYDDATIALPGMSTSSSALQQHKREDDRRREANNN